MRFEDEPTLDDLPDLEPGAEDSDPGLAAFRRDGSKPFLFGVAGAGVLGAIFSGISTADFISHLDRQVHSIHCSLIPGAGAELGESGCRTVMLSPYSSLFRTSMWGGLPISLLALAVFSYLAFRGLDFALRPDRSRRHTGFLLAATALPVLMSLIYGWVAVSLVGAVCKLCVGVYLASGLGFVCAILAHLKAAPPREALRPGVPPFVRWFAEGVAYVAALALIFVLLAPTSDKSAKGCGQLVRTTDKHDILVPVGGAARGTPAIAVLDPLCPACRAFDRRLAASGLTSKLSMRMALFPLDADCNWMVKDSLHPGACAVSEAILCDKAHADRILAWAFEEQEALLELGKRDGARLRERIREKFPETRGCVGTAKARNKLNKSLRWAVANAIPVLTPQLFVGDRRMCDEDTDLGLEYSLTAMLEAAR